LPFLAGGAVFGALCGWAIYMFFKRVGRDSRAILGRSLILPAAGFAVLVDIFLSTAWKVGLYGILSGGILAIVIAFWIDFGVHRTEDTD
jgi:hypothetical protein